MDRAKIVERKPSCCQLRANTKRPNAERLSLTMRQVSMGSALRGWTPLFQRRAVRVLESACHARAEDCRALVESEMAFPAGDPTVRVLRRKVGILQEAVTTVLQWTCSFRVITGMRKLPG